MSSKKERELGERERYFGKENVRGRKGESERERGREIIVVYFDQQMHACSSTYMVENDEIRLKIIYY